MTCLTKENFVPAKKPDTRYTIRMYALKVPPAMLENGRGPKILMQGGYDKASFTPGTEQHSAGWKYFGTIAPKTSSVAFRDMLKNLLTQAVDEHEVSQGTHMRTTFLLGPNGKISNCYSKDIQRAQASTPSLVDPPKQPVLWDIFSGTGSVGSVF